MMVCQSDNKQLTVCFKHRAVWRNIEQQFCIGAF